ncbi:H+/Cl- antiporter ClcA [Kitasatospora sp. SolWspMP-SS2h]|uniref:chloride channel protein n=1 Tax=Kitasatospora sp. SolWspMP-SS2h TaxID=1305729 RepID=UPI000DBFC0D2|nr:chloride channel protein [Kitasatospora sp. SolWspMP-SS2h]RAJ35261.1 H+/Cl- antiporter ClcA [Kitasatospora sp. SolWspMP-SS2h]
MPARAAGSAAPPPGLRELLRSPGYGRLLLVSALVGVPVSLAAFGFVGLEHELQHWVWESLPRQLGHARAPWWWPLPALALAGLLLAPIVTRMPGRGGHTPVLGLGGPPTLPVEVPSVVLAALAALPLGAVLGPEAPLMALGSGLALLTVSAAKRAASPLLGPMLGAAGSTAAIATIFGSPLVAAVMMIEAAGLGGAQLTMLLLPCLLASGVGALVFTGFGHWTGLSIGALSLPSVPRAGLPDAGDFLWGVPLAVVIAVVLVAGQTLGHRCAAFTAHRTAVRTVLCAVLVGGCVAGYALVTGRSPEEAALSGQATLGQLAADPHGWPVGALLALVLFKGLGWGVALGSLRGGPIFPAVLLGAALGVAAGGLPGLGTGAGLAAGLAAGSAAVTRLPVTSTVLAAALLGDQATDSMPLLIVAAVVAFLTATFVHRVAAPGPGTDAGPEPGAGAGPEPGRPAPAGPVQ